MPHHHPEVVVLDLDGTLMDSVYVHAVAWHQAFLAVGLEVPTSRLHRVIGMGGDRVITEVAGPAAEEAVGDVVRERHDREFQARLSDVHPLPGATELLRSCRDAGLTMVLGSSSKPSMTEVLLDRLEGSHLIQEVVSGSAGASKPAPDVVRTALDRVGSREGFLVGDAVWDVLAAARSDIPCVGVLTGGNCEAQLREAGAVAVYDGPGSVAEDLDRLLEALPS